jgi:small-conductance mechanosensitive channel
LEATAKVPRVSDVNPPSAYLLRFGHDGFDVRVGFWIEDPEEGRTNVTSDVNIAIWTILQANQVELPFPQRVITLQQGEIKA